MLATVEIPVDLAVFELPDAVQARLEEFLNRQDSGELLTPGKKWRHRL